MAGQGAIYTIVKSAKFEIGLKLRINRLRVMLVKPQGELFYLLGCERVDRAFDILYGPIHAILLYHGAGFFSIPRPRFSAVHRNLSMTGTNKPSAAAACRAASRMH